jgi:hypothetical protein
MLKPKMTLNTLYQCDSCKKDCTRSQLGSLVHVRDVKPLIKDEKASVTKHFCCDCTKQVRSMLGIEQ